MANSNGNVDDVTQVLDSYHRGSSTEQDSWSPYATTIPRAPAPYISEDEPSVSGTDWDQESHYTTTTRSSRQTSVFSRRTAQSSGSKSTAPSRWREFVGMNPNAGNGNGIENQFVLWCEFRELKGCTTTFRGDDEAAWIQHHIRHLREQFPPELVCWFCDDHPHFVARRDAERRANFVDRMQHIRQHIYDEWFAPENTRPDFYMVDHMYRTKRIDKNTYDMAMAYSELPAAYQAPPAWDDARTSQTAVIYDPKKEERQRRRHGRHGGGRGERR